MMLMITLTHTLTLLNFISLAIYDQLPILAPTGSITTKSVMVVKLNLFKIEFLSNLTSALDPTYSKTTISKMMMMTKMTD